MGRDDAEDPTDRVGEERAQGLVRALERDELPDDPAVMVDGSHAMTLSRR